MKATDSERWRQRLESRPLLADHPVALRVTLAIWALGGALFVALAVPALESIVESVDEAVYRIDRMMTELSLSGVLGKIRGFIFGRCTECDPSGSFGSLTMEEMLAEHIAPLGIPAFSGSMIGHIDEQFTIPLGIDVELDADAGSIRMLEPGVI